MPEQDTCRTLCPSGLWPLWDILAEHDFVARDTKLPIVASFNQQTTYGQLFWDAREWLIPSLIVERILVNPPYQEHLDAIRLDLTGRVASQFTISAGPRIQKDQLTGRISKSVVIQIALKTVH